MSDDDFMYDEDYGFEYEDDQPEEDSEMDVDIENQYYNAKGLKEDKPAEAYKLFEDLVSKEPQPGDWGFKGLKQMIKVGYKQGLFDQVVSVYERLLKHTEHVTRNYSEKTINSVLDLISNSGDLEFLEKVFTMTLDYLERVKNERLWFKANVKLAKLWLDRQAYPRLNKILRALRRSCQTPEGIDDMKKGTQLLEIYSLEIQLYTEKKNNSKLKELYQLSLHIKSAIPHPRIMGIIRECGGKMHLRQGNHAKANTDFFEAFKCYDEAGMSNRIQCLKYLVLATILSMSTIDPFDSQEIKPYKNDPEILAMTNLLYAYQQNQIKDFENILKENKQTIMDDPFIRDFIQELLDKIRTSVLIQLLVPYKRIDLPFLALKLNVDVDEVEELLARLIADGAIDGRIDQIDSIVQLNTKSNEKEERWNAVKDWAYLIDRLNELVAQ